MPEITTVHDISSTADYSLDIHRHLNDHQQNLIKTIGRPISEHILDNREILLSNKNEF
jgi:hypothetical protein